MVRPDPTYADLGSTTTDSKASLTASEVKPERVLLNAVPGVNTGLQPRPTFTNVFLEKGTVSSHGTSANGTVSFNPLGTRGGDDDDRSLFRSNSLEENRDIAQVYMGNTGNRSRLN